MRLYFANSQDAVQYADAARKNLQRSSQLITTTTLERFGEYSVTIATEELSEDTDLQTAKFYSETQVNT